MYKKCLITVLVFCFVYHTCLTMRLNKKKSIFDFISEAIAELESTYAHFELLGIRSSLCLPHYG